MVCFPPSKINLGLHIVNKRPDGYHNLITCFYPLPWTDILEIIPSKSFQFSNTGLSISGDVNENLCIKAYRLLKKDFNLPPIQIHLHKVIPMGAGLGGGSSDAAWTLRLLNEVFNLGISFPALTSYASQLGSDCPFFIDDKAKLGQGRGEILTDVSISLKGKYIVVVKPAIHVSTAEAYSGVNPQQPGYDLKSVLEMNPVSGWQGVLKNDFEESVFDKYPSILKVKNALYEEGAEYASMSGSGSAVFGIFSKPQDLKRKFQEYTVWSELL